MVVALIVYRVLAGEYLHYGVSVRSHFNHGLKLFRVHFPMHSDLLNVSLQTQILFRVSLSPEQLSPLRMLIDPSDFITLSVVHIHKGRIELSYWPHLSIQESVSEKQFFTFEEAIIS